MRLNRLLYASISLVALVGAARAATVTGTVTGPDGKGFRAAFVQAQNLKTKITRSVLSQNDGSYRIKDLPAGDYEVRIKAAGYENAETSKVTLAGDASATKAFALKRGKVSWADLSFEQARKLLPDEKGKSVLWGSCFACHGYETRMYGRGFGLSDFQDRVTYMMTTMHYFLAGRVSEQDQKDVANYMNDMFGKDSKLAKSPEDMPKYAEVAHAPWSDEALKIVYTEYEMPTPSSMPWSAVEDKDGKFWIPMYGAANRIARLDAETAQVEEFTTPHEGTAAIHSAYPAPDGSVWFTQQGSNKVGRWDPKTKQIKEYQDAYIPGKEGTTAGGSKHTLRVLPNGEVWSTGGPLSKFDPKTEKFTGYSEVPSVYGIAYDQKGKVWFAEYTPTGIIGMADPQTDKIEKYAPPTRGARARRIVIDDKGVVWFAEFAVGKVGQYDPVAKSFQEWQLPGSAPTPYAFEVDAKGFVWYSSEHQDVIGRLEPTSGKIIEYPLPYSENTMREFFKDHQGRMWYGTPANNRVGYFTLDE